MSFLEISPEMFFALLPLPCLRGLKSLMSMTTAALHRLPAMNNLLHVGKWFYSDFFGNLHSRFLIKSPCRAPPPTLKPENCGFYMRRVHPPTRYQAGTRLLHAGFLPAWLDHHQFPTRAQKGQTSSTASPPAANLLPEAPWSAASRVRNVEPPFQHPERCRSS